MPIYVYRCDNCNHEAEEYQRIDDEPLEHCPDCGGGPDYYRRRPCRTHTAQKDFHKPIEMHSAACTSWEEIREIQAKCPDVQISDDPNDPKFGIPIAANRHQKKKVLKVAGLQEAN